jgi:predicted ATPase
LKERRRTIHNQILVALEDEADIATEILAYHADAAGLADRAIDYFLKAGQRAILMSANAEAIAHLSKGLEILGTLREDAERARRELDFLTAIGPALVAVKGYAAPDLEPIYRRTLELCEELGDVAKQFSTIHGVSLYHFIGGDLQGSRKHAEQLVELAKSRQDHLSADRALGYALHFLGDFRLCYERVMNSYDIAVHGSYAFRHAGSDFGVGAFGMNGMANFILGYPDQAKDQNAQALALARKLEHPISVAFAHWNTGLVHQLRGEATAAYEHAETGMLIAEEKGFVQFVAWMKVLRNWALFEQNGSAEALAGMRQGIDDNRAIGSNLLVPHWISLLAGAYGRAGQAEEGLTLVAEAIAEIARRDERICEAELHRVKGQLLLKSNDANGMEAEACFHYAIEVARSQKAKSWEVRAVTSLAGLWQAQGKHTEAHDLLAAIYGWFTEGLDTPDLIDAKTLLNDLK